MKKRILAIVAVALLGVLVLASCSNLPGPPTPGASDIAAASTVSQAATSAQGTASSTASGAAAQTQQGGLMATLIQIVPFIAIFVAFYFFAIRPQKKKEKETQSMRNNIQVGDEITTIGGIIGRVVTIKDDDQFVIETGSDKTKIRIARWAVQQKNTISG